MASAERLNQLDADTRWGYRTFELWHGDITKLTFPIDLLLLAQAGKSQAYSLYRSLKSELSISVHELKETRELDFVQPMGVWVSGPTGNKQIKRVMCVELLPDESASKKIRDAFLVLPILVAHGVELGTISLPILGAGGIGLKADDVVRPILDGSYWALTNIEKINRVCFVDIVRDKALTMSKDMDDVLGRVKLTIAKGEEADRLRSIVLNAIDKATALDADFGKLASDIRAAIKPEGRSVQVGNAGRQLSEYVLKRVLPSSAKQSLFDRIERVVPVPLDDRIDVLKTSPAATWMNGYFHLLRLLGNEVSHHEDLMRIPRAIEDKDLHLILLAIERVLAFWIAWRSQRQE